MIDLQNRLLLCIIDCRACRPSSRRAWTSRRASPWPRCGTPRGGRGTWTSTGTGMGPASWAGVAQLPRRRELKMGALDLGKMGVSCKEKKILGSPDHPTTRRSKLPPRPHLKSSQCAAEGWSWTRNRHGAGDAPADNPGHAENRVRTIPDTPWTQVDSRGRADGSKLGVLLETGHTAAELTLPSRPPPTRTVVVLPHASGEAERRRARVPSAAAATNVHASERPRCISSAPTRPPLQLPEPRRSGTKRGGGGDEMRRMRRAAASTRPRRRAAMWKEGRRQGIESAPDERRWASTTSAFHRCRRVVDLRLEAE
jgi:hypothetical protein